MKVKSTLIGLGLLAIASGCSTSDEFSGGALEVQKAILYNATTSQPEMATYYQTVPIKITDEDNGKTKEASFFVKLSKENNQEVDVQLSIQPQLVKKFNETYDKKFQVFPQEKIVEFTNKLEIKNGNTSSANGVLKLSIDPDLKLGEAYLIPVSVVNVSNASPLGVTNTIYYEVRKINPQIENVVTLTRDDYLAIESNNSYISLSGTFTMEGLVYVDKFRGPGDPGEAGITTFMGTEGETLLRFGDSGVPPNHLQANGTEIQMDFLPKKWYHIAIVVDAGQISVYVNGSKKQQFAKSGALREFFIGRSWSDNRGLAGKVSEIRLWSVARTAAEIKTGMYGVKPDSNGLFAYWKMNAVKDNNKIEDVSGNGRDLILKSQGRTSTDAIKLEKVDGIDVLK